MSKQSAAGNCSKSLDSGSESPSPSQSEFQFVSVSVSTSEFRIYAIAAPQVAQWLPLEETREQN